jgi:hypothetical protein
MQGVSVIHPDSIFVYKSFSGVLVLAHPILTSILCILVLFIHIPLAWCVPKGTESYALPMYNSTTTHFCLYFLQHDVHLDLFVLPLVCIHQPLRILNH